MELELRRLYFPNGTNGEFVHDGAIVCYSIELTWKDNHQQTSCIPEGRYGLVKRYSPKFKEHLCLQKVTGRDLILIHPANDAQKELRGCIAPVSILTAEGKGLGSMMAFEKLKAIVFPKIKTGEQIFLTIKSLSE
ncbi:MAG: hypothetical protein JST58_10620 [Bacteroidetes bacterium]|nr:hypothetical protein [Bacteroidota bacterium]